MTAGREADLILKDGARLHVSRYRAADIKQELDNFRDRESIKQVDANRFRCMLTGC